MNLSTLTDFVGGRPDPNYAPANALYSSPVPKPGLLPGRKLQLCLLLTVTGALALSGQTRVDVSAQAKNIDFSTATATKPFKTGTVLPSICTLGEAFFKTNAAAGANWYACTAPNLWSVQSGAAGPGGGATRAADLSDLTVTLASPTTLSIAAGSWGSGNTTFTYAGGNVSIRSLNVSGASNSNPVRLNVPSTAGLRSGDTVMVSGVQGNTGANGTFTIAIPNGTQIDLTGSIGTGAYTGGGVVAGRSNGTAYIYGSEAGYLIVEHSASASVLVSCSGNCVVNQVPAPSFAANSVPLAVANITGGNWVFASDARRFMSSRAIAAGQGIGVSDAGGTARISVDTTVARIPAANNWTGANSFTAATRTAPFRSGNGSPATQNCVAGDTYWQLDATAGENLWGCTASGNPGAWQVLAAASASRLPVIEEEFMTASATANDFGQHHWRNAGDNAPVPDQLTGPLGYQHPGLYSLTSNASANSTSAMTLSAANGAQQFVSLGDNPGWIMEAIVVTDSAFSPSQMGLRFGLTDNAASPSAANSIQVRFNNNTGCSVTGSDAFLVFENRNAGASTSAASALAPSASQSIHLRARSLIAGTVLFSISSNGGPFSAETAVANAPTAPLSPFFAVSSCSGATRKLYVDYFRFTPGTLVR